MRPPARVRSEDGSRRTQRERSVADAATLEDVRRLALRYWPRGVRDYVEGGADDEVTLGRNRAAYQAVTLHPAVLRDVDDVDLTTTVLGRASAVPIVLSPTGYTRMMHPGAEAAVARAAGSRSVPYVVSTMATTTVEAVAAAAGADLWFQLYLWRNRALSYALMERAWESGCRALVVTVDTPVTGLRVRDARNGFTIPPRITPRTALDMASHPAWSLAMLRGEMPTFANVAAERGGGPMGVMAFSAAQFDPTTSWDDLAEIRRRWPGALVLKGVLGADDAVRAFGSGVDAVVLSNHGGRQLDRAATPLQVLARVRAAVGQAAELHVDSGIRSGVDIAVALAAGADTVGIGRPYLYGLGAAGQRGVEAVLDILSAGLARTMRLLGVTSVAELRAQGPSLLTSPELAPSPSRRMTS